jgi:hypothetical protein
LFRLNGNNHARGVCTKGTFKNRSYTVGID